MSILSLQKRLVEVGRIRMGEKRTSQSGKQYPAKLSTWRLTSNDAQRLRAVAEVYGGEVKSWDGQYEVVTKASALDIALIPGQALSQHMELWGQTAPKQPVICLRRCDGLNEVLSDSPCLCKAEAGDDGDIACKPTTHLMVMLRRVPGIGAWRLSTRGWYAAQELSGTAGMLEQLTASGQLVPARLRLDQRTVVKADGNKNFVVPVIDIDVTLDQVLAATGFTEQPAVSGNGEQKAIGTPFTPVPVNELPAGPTMSVREQLNQPAPVANKRSNAAAPIPSTGRRPRGAVIAEVADEVVGVTPSPPGVPDEGGVSAAAGGPTPGESADTPPNSSRPVNRVAIAAREAGLDDDGRHDLAEWASVGRTRSSAALDASEQAHAVDMARKIRDGHAVLRMTEEGGWEVRDPRFGWPADGEHPVTGSSNPDTVADVAGLSADEIVAMKGPQLVAALKDRSLPLGGKVEELRARLMDACGVTGQDSF